MGSVSPTLAQHERVRKSCSTTGNVDGSTTSKVKASHFKDPARAVPCPAGDGIVDDCRPDKHENLGGSIGEGHLDVIATYHTRKHSSTFGNGTNGQSHSDSGEHALVDGEKEVGDLR